MIEIADRYAIADDLDAHVLQTSNRVFVCLVGTGKYQGLRRCWSANRGADSASLCVDLKTRLSLCSDAEYREGSYWFPAGWAFWGGGVPEPLADFYDHRRHEVDAVPPTELVDD